MSHSMGSGSKLADGSGTGAVMTGTDDPGTEDSGTDDPDTDDSGTDDSGTDDSGGDVSGIGSLDEGTLDSGGEAPAALAAPRPPRASAPAATRARVRPLVRRSA
jgi:hypothetical protein